MKGLVNGKRTKGNKGSGAPTVDDEMLWVGPILYYSAPMDIVSRDKKMKESKVCFKELLVSIDSKCEV
jgi:hypothetical protein